MGRPSNKERAAREAAKQAEQKAVEVPQAPTSELVEAQSPSREQDTHVDIKDDARDQLMDEIVQKREAHMAEEELKEAKKEEPKAEEKKEEAKAETPREEVKVETPKEEVKAEEKAEPVKVKQKVDGQEYDVLQSEIDEAGGERAWRIQKASENRLARANEVLAEANKARAELAEFRKQQTPQAPVKSNADFIKEKMDVIRFGSPEESAAAMMEVISRNNADPNQIVVQATTNFKHEMALSRFREEYKDIVTNPILGRLVPALMHEALSPYTKNGTIDWSGLSNLDWNAEFSKVGNQIRSAAPRPSQSQPEAATPSNPSSGTSDKEARKSSIVNLPTASARAELPKEDKPESREDTLNWFRKDRGLPVS